MPNNHLTTSGTTSRLVCETTHEGEAGAAMVEEVYSYHISGMRIQSQVPLLPMACNLREHDVTIVRGAVAGPPSDLATESNWHFAADNTVGFSARGVGQFLVRNGTEVRIQPEPNATDSMIRPFLLGSAMGYLLHQRGRLPLHASGVKVGDGCVVFLGRRSMGKSTLAAFLNARRYEVVCDDICAANISNAGPSTVAPGYPRVKLWPASIQALGHDVRACERVAANTKKRFYSVDQLPAERTLPLKRIYLLQWGSDLGLRRMPAVDGMIHLRRFTYRRWILREPKIAGQNFALCSKLALQVPIFSLQRPQCLDRMGETLDCLENDFRSFSISASAEPPQSERPERRAA